MSRAPKLPAMRVLSVLLFSAVVVVLAGCSSTPPPPPHLRGKPVVVYPELSMDQSADIAVHALGLVGTPYRYGGNTPAGGFDCSGLIGYVYRSRAGVTPPRTVGELAGFGRPIEAGELRTGDLVIFGVGRPSHAGIYVGEGRFVHAPSTGGAVRMDRLSSTYWARQPTSYRRP